jgi:hypothetical protein
LSVNFWIDTFFGLCFIIAFFFMAFHFVSGRMHTFAQTHIKIEVLPKTGHVDYVYPERNSFPGQIDFVYPAKVKNEEEQIHVTKFFNEDEVWTDVYGFPPFISYDIPKIIYYEGDAKPAVSKDGGVATGTKGGTGDAVPKTHNPSLATDSQVGQALNNQFQKLAVMASEKFRELEDALLKAGKLNPVVVYIMLGLAIVLGIVSVVVGYYIYEYIVKVAIATGVAVR